MEPKVTKQNVPQDKRSLQLMHTLCSLLASHSARIARLQTHSGPLNIVSLENVQYQINTHLHSGNLHYYNYIVHSNLHTHDIIQHVCGKPPKTVGTHL